MLLIPNEALRESNVTASDLLIAEIDSVVSNLTEEEEEEEEEEEAKEASSPSSASSSMPSLGTIWLSPATISITKLRNNRRFRAFEGIGSNFVHRPSCMTVTRQTKVKISQL
mgnify:CR=1 FL=1